MQPLIDTKKCKTCGEVKGASDFSKHKQTKDGLASSCKSCVRERSRKWYAENKDKAISGGAERLRKSKLYAISRFGDKCHACGGTFPPCVYDFHHLDDSTKEGNPSSFFGMKRDRLDAELDKCVMLCANCHRVRHFMEGD